jgi:hypothetical protein
MFCECVYLWREAAAAASLLHGGFHWFAASSPSIGVCKLWAL